MKRSITAGRCEEVEGSRKVCLSEESRKFTRVDFMCHVSNPGQMEFVTRQRPETKIEKSSRPLESSSFQVDGVIAESQPLPLSSCVSGSSCDNRDTETEDTTTTDTDPFPSHEDASDVKLITDNGCFTAPRSLLIESSDYFRAMFSVDMLEKTKTSIYLKGLDAVYLERYLNFVRFGKIDINGYNDALQLLQFSVYLQCTNFIEFCSLYITSHLNAENACAVLLLTRELALVQLEGSTLNFIFNHFTELDRRNTGVESLLAKDMVWLIESDRLGGECNRCCELSVMKIALRWLLHNPAATEEEQESIISNVRFSLIQPEKIKSACQQILTEFESKDGIARSMDCMRPVVDIYLKNAMIYHQQLYEQPLKQTRTTNVRSTSHTWVSVDGVLAPSAIKLPRECQCLFTDRSTHIRDPFHSVVELNGFLFVLGGTREIDGGFSNVVIRYDPRLNTFIQLSPMSERRGDFVAFPYHNRIYVFGGRNKDGGLKSCECYDISSNTWKYVHELPQSLYMAAGVETEGKLYLSGGFRNHLAVAETLCFDPETDTWENRSFYPMFQPRGYHVMTKESDGRLWAVGGIDNSLTGRNVHEVEALDMRTGMWSFVGYVLPVSFLSSTMRLNILRNEDGNICISAVSSSEKYPMLEYDDKTRKWSEMKQPVPSMMGVSFPTGFHLA